MASGAVSDGQVRVNGSRCDKPSFTVKADDVLTFVAGDRVRVVRVLALGTRRGPASEAQLLYEDLTPAPEAAVAPASPSLTRDKGTGRPTKRDRRAIDAHKNRETDN